MTTVRVVPLLCQPLVSISTLVSYFQVYVSIVSKGWNVSRGDNFYCSSLLVLGGGSGFFFGGTLAAEAAGTGLVRLSAANGL